MCISLIILMYIDLVVAELKAEAARIEHEAELECQARAREAEIQFLREQNELETGRARELGGIEVKTHTRCEISHSLVPSTITITYLTV